MSTIQVSPYVNFQGRAREAMEFYSSVLGGTLELYTINEQGVASVAGPEDRIGHALLVADGVRIFASDGHPSYPPTVGDNIAIALSGADEDRISGIFQALAEGGYIKMPLTAQPWGQIGWLADRFGINWMVTVTQA